MSKRPGSGRLIVLSGPSGVGKDTVIAELIKLRPSLRHPPAYTTRPARTGEIDGRDYSFVSSHAFSAMEADGQFLETASVHGNRYGTSRSRVEELLAQGYDVLLKLDVQGAAQLRAAGTEAIFVFLAPPSREVLLDRLRRRETESPAELAIRTRDADRELAEAEWYHHQVVNDEVHRAARKVSALLEAALGPS